MVFSERDVRYVLSPVRLSSVCLSVCLSVTLVRPTQPVEIFGNVSTPFGTLAIHPLTSTEKFTEIAQGNPFVGGGAVG